MKYRAKPVVVEAYRFDGPKVEPGWPGWWLGVSHWFSADGKHVFFRNRFGEVDVLKGNWIVKANGEFFAVTDEDFDLFYEKYPNAVVIEDKVGQLQ